MATSLPKQAKIETCICTTYFCLQCISINRVYQECKNLIVCSVDVLRLKATGKKQKIAVAVSKLLFCWFSILNAAVYSSIELGCYIKVFPLPGVIPRFHVFLFIYIYF